MPQENIKVSLLYLAKERPVVWRGTQIIRVDDEAYLLIGRKNQEIQKIRFRTLEGFPLTASVDSGETTMEEVVRKVTELKPSERAARLNDGDREYSMAKKKTGGFFE